MDGLEIKLKNESFIKRLKNLKILLIQNVKKEGKTEEDAGVEIDLMTHAWQRDVIRLFGSSNCFIWIINLSILSIKRLIY